MEPRTLHELAQACQGILARGAAHLRVQRVCTDSRQVRTGDLFVALRGQNFDGHDYLSEAARKGASGVLVSTHRPIPHGLTCGVITVHDPRPALSQIAAAYRAAFDLPVIAVAGSNGKTTTKNLIASVLSQGLKTLASEASFNNDIGVPLTLLRLDHTHQAAVLEVGTNHPGELAPLLRTLQPQWGVLTGIGPEHLEFFGDLDGVAREEGWLAELLPPDGRMFVNGDSPALAQIERRCQARIERVGWAPTHDWRATQVEVSRQGTSFNVSAPHTQFCGGYRLALLGRHQVTNGLLAIAVGAALGLNPEQIRSGLLACSPAPMRLELWQWNGVDILDDGYNANVDSVKAALQTLRDLSCEGQRIAVLGDMAELGDRTQAAHEEAGRHAARCGVDVLLGVGQWAEHTVRAAREAGLREARALAPIEAAASFLATTMRPGDLVLLKASRAAGFEAIPRLWGARGSRP